MKTIRVGEYLAFVDDIDFALVSTVKWHPIKRGRQIHAKHSLPKGKSLYMHRLILKAPPNMLCDHIDQNGLNNTRNNIRLATPHQNQCNQPKQQTTSSSKFKGVFWNTQYGKWEASIKVNGKRIYLGRYREEGGAAHAYDVASIKYHGDFAWRNFQ